MGIYANNATRDLNEAWWSLDRGQIVSSFRSAQRAADELGHIKDVDGQLGKRASKIEKALKDLLRSFKEQPGVYRRPKAQGGTMVERPAGMKVDDKAKVKKGIVDTTVQVQKLKAAIARNCGLPMELLRP